MIAPIGLGLLLIVVGICTLVIPGIGILGIVFGVIGVLLIVGAFARGGRQRTATGPPPKL